MLYAPALTGTGSPRASRYAMESARCTFSLRMGARISSSGASTRSATSKRTWSLPAPVEPCPTAVAPTCRATSMTESACWVRSADTLSG